MTGPTGPAEPPRTPDDTRLTSEEWEAVQRLRARGSGRGAAVPAAPAPAAPAPAAPAPAAPAPAAPAPADAAPVAADGPAPDAERAEPLGAEAAVGGDARRGGRVAAVLPAVTFLVVLALVAVVLAVLTTLKVSDRNARTHAGTQAVAAAASGVATVLSYNYKSLDNDFTKAESLLTPAFRKTYDATTAKAVQPLAAKYKAVSTAQVTAAGVISAAPSKASVLVFVSQQVTNTQLSAPRLDRSRIVVDLVRQHGRWLIAKLSPV